MISLILEMNLESFKAASGEAAALELKMRLLAGMVPALQTYAHQRKLGEIETDILKEFDRSLSADEKDTLKLSRELRNKVIHSDFRATREQLEKMRIQTGRARTKKIELPVATKEELSKKIAGGGGTPISDLPSGEVYGWLLEVGRSGDFQKARYAFKNAAAIIDRLVTDRALAEIKANQSKPQ
jgi:hypothetical protein